MTLLYSISLLAFILSQQSKIMSREERLHKVQYSDVRDPTALAQCCSVII